MRAPGSGAVTGQISVIGQRYVTWHAMSQEIPLSWTSLGHRGSLCHRISLGHRTCYVRGDSFVIDILRSQGVAMSQDIHLSRGIAMSQDIHLSRDIAMSQDIIRSQGMLCHRRFLWHRHLSVTGDSLVRGHAAVTSDLCSTHLAHWFWCHGMWCPPARELLESLLIILTF